MAERFNQPLMAKSNAGLLCKLKHKKSGKEFILATTHLHWNPQNDYVKYVQMYNMFEKI